MALSEKAAVLCCLVFLLATYLCNADDGLEMCCLCNGCEFPVRGSEPVDPYGKTCNDLALEMADPTNDSAWHSSSCAKLKNQHYDRCCNPNYDPPVILQAPAPSPADEYSQGSNPTCNLCKDGSYPGRPFTINAVLQFQDRGNLSCKDLYYMGIKGQIPDQLCKPMQYALETPCGCGLESENDEGGSNSNGDGGSSGGGGGGDNNGGSNGEGTDNGGWWKGLHGSSKAADPRMYMVIALWCILFAGLFYMVRRKINELKEDQ